MNKSIIQIFIFIIIIILIYFFYVNFFTNQSSPLKSATPHPTKKISKESNMNVIENISYFSKDKKGNEYTIQAKSALSEIGRDNNAELSGVSSKIILFDKNEIFITSNSANYNETDNNTNFIGNVTILYENNKINSDFIDLNFINNKIDIYGNVKLTYENNILYADRISLNLLSKNIKIIMNDKNDKILLKSLYN